MDGITGVRGLSRHVKSRVRNFRQKIIPRKTEQTEQMIISDVIPAVPRNRNLSEFRSETFQGRENNSEFRSVEQKQKHTLGIRFRTLPRKRKQLGIPFRGTKIETNCRNSVPNHAAEEKQLGIPFRVEQNAAGYKKTGLGERNKLIYDCYVIIYSSLRTVQNKF